MKKAFVHIERIGPAGDGTRQGNICGSYVLLGEDDKVLRVDNCNTDFGHGDTAATLHDNLASQIREANDDPTIVVVFPGSIDAFS